MNITFSCSLRVHLLFTVVDRRHYMSENTEVLRYKLAAWQLAYFCVAFSNSDRNPIEQLSFIAFLWPDLRQVCASFAYSCLPSACFLLRICVISRGAVEDISLGRIRMLRSEGQVVLSYW